MRNAVERPQDVSDLHNDLVVQIVRASLIIEWQDGDRPHGPKQASEILRCADDRARQVLTMIRRDGGPSSEELAQSLGWFSASKLRAFVRDTVIPAEFSS